MQKIAVSPQEITGNLSLGQTIDHIAAVIIPVAGGIMWEAFGARYTFLVGLAIVVVALMLTTRMHTWSRSRLSPWSQPRYRECRKKRT